MYNNTQIQAFLVTAKAKFIEQMDIVKKKVEYGQPCVNQWSNVRFISAIIRMLNNYDEDYITNGEIDKLMGCLNSIN